MEADLGRLGQVEVLALYGKRLADPRAGIVEEQQESVVAQPEVRSTVRFP
jgi:hypothetical protein